MARQSVIVMDCGSTTTRVVAVDQAGKLLAQASAPSGPSPQKGGEKGWLVWDLDALWKRLARLSRKVCSQIPTRNIVAVTATTWGADGAPVAADGTPTYPPICWQCPRTEPTAAAITDDVSAWQLFKTTGYQVIAFNTLLRLIWLRRHAPKALDGAACWMMMAGLLSHRLCGELSIDYTGASTMMAMDLGRRSWSPRLLKLAGVAAAFFPRPPASPPAPPSPPPATTPSSPPSARAPASTRPSSAAAPGRSSSPAPPTSPPTARPSTADSSSRPTRCPACICRSS